MGWWGQSHIAMSWGVCARQGETEAILVFEEVGLWKEKKGGIYKTKGKNLIDK